ncbi:hypothetical protein GPECTOR_15g371 [Gonium pectorale]|uniref:Uncharacterized protein n=1 Tax=Gonium pectorale TaxID=33097 RepID=A0A150GLL8_GONPE|nr:hypothetical protein GPECTOR_15g371 [Gonium pectorale]|eukprot:KXZ50687.1 hypothetical protein GPECTOR_15g371 [Gonium pectorale]
MQGRASLPEAAGPPPPRVPPSQEQQQQRPQQHSSGCDSPASTSASAGAAGAGSQSRSGSRGGEAPAGADGHTVAPPGSSGSGGAQAPAAVAPLAQQPGDAGAPAAGDVGASVPLPLTPQTALALQQAALRKEVQKDIQRMLAGNRAYQKALHGPQVLSADSLTKLAKPKLRGPAGPEAQVAAQLPDPVDWAVWKTEQLAISRLTEERRVAEATAEKRTSAEALARFKQHKAAVERAKAEAKARAAAEEAAYRATMSTYLNHRGAMELEDYKKKREGERERLALQRSRNAKGVDAHHY